VIERLDPAVPLLQVFDMPASLGFYCDVIGFQVVDKTAGWAMIRRCMLCFTAPLEVA